MCLGLRVNNAGMIQQCWKKCLNHTHYKFSTAESATETQSRKSEKGLFRASVLVISLCLNTIVVSWARDGVVWWWQCWKEQLSVLGLGVKARQGAAGRWGSAHPRPMLSSPTHQPHLLCSPKLTKALRVSLSNVHTCSHFQPANPENRVANC